MRFRHKLSIVLVGLAVVPLAAAGVLVGALLERDQVTRVDNRVSGSAQAVAQAFSLEAVNASSYGQRVAADPKVALLFAGKQAPVRMPASVTPPSGMTVVLVGKDRNLIAGKPPSGPALRTQTVYRDPKNQRIGAIEVYVRLGQPLLQKLTDARWPENVGFALVVRGRVVASSNGPGGSASGLNTKVGSATVDGTDVRAQAIRLRGVKGGPAYIVATYPESTLSNAIDSQRLRILVPLLLLGLVLVGGAIFAADRISRALTELAGRAAGLTRGRTGGDELTQLGATIDEISTELTSRMGELEAERGRFKETLQRYGETLAATHDLNALVNAVLDTAVQATRARGGRLLLYDAERGEAIEQARIGTARGMRSDLPVVVAAGDGLEGEALATHEPRVSQVPRAVLATPILREHHLLGLVTAVDPEEGAFSDEDVEALSALAVQAGVAIENARLHRVVERQAVTDSLTGLANRRQFYEVLGREYERAQRFGQAVSLILLDIDDFKLINDSRGHLAGDAVLHSVAATLAEVIREIDLAARYGGEEFAVLLPQTGPEGAANLAERLRSEIAARSIRFGTEEITGVTASFGVAAGPVHDQTQIDLIASADAALYQAKREGKNHVTVSGAW
ncbi:MAG TPA: sensor domain-containing diguanylate cyclase [Gaiellales bacterium]|jgi:diguanylate cyclase (GGDEF)-like protein|nr:sensor domain-containing diguanylate cyclase [Gaiellales bacterium]